MPSHVIKLSELVDHLQETIQDRFEGEAFWITTQIVDVKKQEGARRCYLKFVEKEGNNITTEIRGVFWSSYYSQIEDFEKFTRQKFTDGIEITCLVRIKFHPKFGLSLEALQIDFAYTLGTLEIDRQQTLDRLVKENPGTIRMLDGIYRTFNHSLAFPDIIKRIALITAPNSDGQRDFRQETEKNKHGYSFIIKEFLTQIQGDNAHLMIMQQLKLVEQQKANFDVVVIVRGGGSQTDFKPFDHYDLCQYVAGFPLPIVTGIGHDRNTSIADMMARQQKTPTKVASLIVDHNLEFENRLIALKERFFDTVSALIEEAKNDLTRMKRFVKLASPSTILNKGFAIVMSDNKIITDTKKIKIGSTIQTLLKNEIIHSTVISKEKNENKDL
ncbi:exodeoxyribonuclease VII large subunit [soil metagenome]